MLRLALLPILVGTAIACSDPVATAPDPNYPIQSHMVTVAGTLLSVGLLRSPDGALIALSGANTQLMVDLVGEDVWVRGTLDGPDGSLVVDAFGPLLE